MSLETFLHGLLSSHDVSGSAVQIVQDNAKLNTNNTEQRISTSCRPPRLCRWSSCDSHLLMKQAAPQAPVNNQNCRWTAGRNMPRPGTDSSPEAPQRRGACHAPAQPMLKTVKSDSDFGTFSKGLLSSLPKDVKTHKRSMKKLQDEKEEELESSELESLIEFYNSTIVGLNQKQKQKQQTYQDGGSLRRHSASSCAVSPRLPVRIISPRLPVRVISPRQAPSNRSMKCLQALEICLA